MHKFAAATLLKKEEKTVELPYHHQKGAPLLAVEKSE
jgi:hypothetical protein